MPPQAGEAPEITGLQRLLDEVETASRNPADGSSQVSLDDILDRLGRRSFAPMLLLAGLIMLAPVIGDIPGVPVVLGMVVILVASQLLLRREHVWLPRWLLRRSVSADKVRKAVRWLRRPARFVDDWSARRQTWLVRHAGVYVIAAACIVVAAATPLMEVVPFSANFAGAAITALGLALLTEDGLIDCDWAGLLAVVLRLRDDLRRRPGCRARPAPRATTWGRGAGRRSVV